ncbi:DAK2 domain-containing protein [Mycoplasma anatis]|nr:DAK2 domain-containing protein [Mycoplasmopsis anatis]
MYQFFAGKPVEISQSSEQIDKFINDTEVYNGEFGYCTEFIIDLSNPTSFNKEEFTKSIGEIATSLVVVNDDNILKVHGHTVKPGDMLNFGQNYGEFIKIKSENMTLQANNSKATAEDLKESKDEQKKSLCGIISCNLGTGIIERMREYGCDYIIESGQTQNPSAQDLIDAINSVNAETVFVLPNNSNILLVSQQAAQVVNDKNVIIIPTKTQIEGITALINFNKDNTAEDNQEIMLEAIKDVTTGEVTKSVRTTKLNGINIKEGEFISITRGQIIASCDTHLEASKKLIARMVKKNHEIISIYYGDVASESDAIELQNWIEGNYDIEVEIINGNQPNYQFIIGVE